MFIRRASAAIFARPINPFPNKPWFLRVCNPSVLKTLWEKEKLLVTSNFSFSHSVFYPFGELSAIFIKFEIVVCKHFEFGRVLNLSFGKGLRRHYLKRCCHFSKPPGIDLRHWELSISQDYAVSNQIYFLSSFNGARFRKSFVCLRTVDALPHDYIGSKFGNGIDHS